MINKISMQNMQLTDVSANRLGPDLSVRKNSGTDFGEMLKKYIGSIDNQMKTAQELTTGLVSGRHANIHETMIAMEKASISFRMMTSLQRKAIEAYQEAMRIQL